MASSSLMPKPDDFTNFNKIAVPPSIELSQAPSATAGMMSLSNNAPDPVSTSFEQFRFKQEQPTDNTPPEDHQGALSLLSLESTLPVRNLSVIMERSRSTSERWQSELDRAVKGIVTIKYSVARRYDRPGAGSFGATGFVVDRARGLILSNRHVVNPGPTTSTALFNKYEEIRIEPVYSDPVHDFGFFKFDPKHIKFAEVEEIGLYPQGAKVGLDIRVCGNNAGEQRSILSGTLASLDRACPFDSDFNTFYYQGVIGASTGSSGSPVLGPSGEAVAMCTGGHMASTYCLPLDRVLRALKLIQEGKPVPRGTLQTTFIHVSYDMLRRMGLSEEIETISRERHPEGTGLLVVAGVVLDGPGYLAGLQTGDILLSCFHPAFGQRYVDSFYSLWDVMDEIVGDCIQLVVSRGSKTETFEPTVQDLHSLVPNAIFEVGEANIHPVSYKVARLNNLPCKGLMLISGGLFNAVTPCVITELEENEVESLDDFIEAVRSIPDGKKIKFKYRVFRAWQESIGFADIDHRFHGMSLFKRNGAVWERHTIMPKPTFDSTEVKRTLELGTELTWSEHLMKTLVKVRCRRPYPIQGCADGVYVGLGVLLELRPCPMIVVSRDIVPVSMCDLKIDICERTFTGRILYLGIVAVITVDGNFLHPTLQVPSISAKDFKIGDEIEIFALDGAQQVVQKRTIIKDIGGLVDYPANTPRFRITNVEAIYLMDPVASMGGLLIDPEDKSVMALWISLNDGGHVGLSHNFYIRPIIASLKSGQSLPHRSCGWSLGQLNLIHALQFQLKDDRAIRIATLAKEIHSVPRPVCVSRALRPFPQTDSILKVGDIILEIDNLPVTRLRDAHILSQCESARVLVSRNGEEIIVDVHPYLLPSEFITKIVLWAGAICHQTHYPVLEQVCSEFFDVSQREEFTDPADGVYINALGFGSPSSTSLPSSCWILEVDGCKIRSMDDMLEIMKKLKSKDEYVRVKSINRAGGITISTPKLDSKFWPAQVLEWKDEGWVRTELE